jgi:hypothetical protein
LSFSEHKGCQVSAEKNRFNRKASAHAGVEMEEGLAIINRIDYSAGWPCINRHKSKQIQRESSRVNYLRAEWFQPASNGAQPRPALWQVHTNKQGRTG